MELVYKLFVLLQDMDDMVKQIHLHMFHHHHEQFVVVARREN
jgi:hypothetical protein